MPSTAEIGSKRPLRKTPRVPERAAREAVNLQRDQSFIRRFLGPELQPGRLHETRADSVAAVEILEIPVRDAPLEPPHLPDNPGQVQKRPVVGVENARLEAAV
jgi:hypothetical protein